MGHPLCSYRSYRLGMGLSSYQIRICRVCNYRNNDR